MGKCDVMGCDTEAVRSVPRKEAEEALFGLEFVATGRRMHLCKSHYRSYKKKTKGKREMERLDW